MARKALLRRKPSREYEKERQGHGVRVEKRARECTRVARLRGSALKPERKRQVRS